MPKRASFYSLAVTAVLIIGLLLALAGVLSAVQTLYVNGTTGSDYADCGSAVHPCKTINYAVKKAPPDSIIDLAAGTYIENVIIDKKNLSLRGKGTTGTSATIINGNNLGPALAVFGPARVDLINLAITKGNPGLNANYAFINCETVKITYSNRGVNAAFNTYLKFKNSQANNNIGDGILLFSNASGFIESSKFLQNSGSGVSTNMGSSLNALNSTFANNQSAGLFFHGGASGKVRGCIVSGNKFNGLHIPGKSTVFIAGGNKITGNTNAGVQYGQGSEVGIQADPGTLPDEINANNGVGIIVGDQGHLFFFSGKVYNNTGDGIVMAGNAMTHFGAAAYITGNAGWGINCMDAISQASRYVNDPGFSDGNVTGNTLGQIKCQKHF